jgi:hypothetical protein
MVYVALMKLVPAQPGICGFEFYPAGAILVFFYKGGIIMPDTELQREHRVSHLFLHFNRQTIFHFIKEDCNV